MTVTPAPSPGVWPVDDEVAAIEQKIAELQRAADQAQASSSLAASEVAIAQKAIRDLTTAKAEIQEKGRLWDREAELQRALAERKAVADRVRQALASGGTLADQNKKDLEKDLISKAGIGPGGDLNAVFKAVKDADDLRQADDTKAKQEWQTAADNLAIARQNYASKAAAAEEAWAAIQNSSRQLATQLNAAQQHLEEAGDLTKAVESPVPLPATPKLNPAAAAAGLAWKDFVDAYDTLKATTGAPTATGRTDKGEEKLVSDWEKVRDEVRNALAVLLEAEKVCSIAQQAHAQRQAPRPGRSADEREKVLNELRTKALNPGP